jgi:hypothetical protein
LKHIAPLTRGDILGCHLRRTACLDMGRGGHGYLYDCLEHDRLLVSDVYDRKTRTKARTFIVDNVRCADLDDAVARLNGPPPGADPDQLDLI